MTTYFSGVNDDRQDFKYVGVVSQRGRQSYAMANGTAKYNRDMQKEGTLHARALRCPYGRAEVEILDTAEAEALEGVVAVIRWDDADLQQYPKHERVGAAITNKAEYEGDECGLIVVAQTEEIAKRALDLAKVKWTVLPHILDPREGMKDGAPLLRPELNPKGNIGGDMGHYGKIVNVTETGDVVAGFAAADHIIEFDVYQPNYNTFRPMPTAYLSYWEQSGFDNLANEPLLYVNGAQQTGNDGVFGQARRFLDLSEGQMRGTTVYCGGTYCNYAQQRGAGLAPYLSRRLGRPVRMAYSRRDEFAFNPSQLYYHVKVGFTNNGTMTTVQSHLIHQSGAFYGYRLDPPRAYASQNGGFELSKCANRHVTLQQVFTNGTGTVSEPGPGKCDAFNTACIKVAEKLGMDPLDIMRMNVPDTGRYSLDLTLDAGMKEFGWKEKQHAPGTRTLPDGRLHGAAVLIASQGVGGGENYNINLALKPDGKVYLPINESLIGTYWPEMYQLVIAEELGMKVEDVVVYVSLDNVNWNQGSSNDHASSGTYCAKESAVLLKQRIISKGFSQLGATSPDQVDLVDSELILKADPSKKRDLLDLGPVHAFADNNSPYRPRNINPLAVMNCDFCEVAVDPETGEVEILDMVMVHDYGKIFRPSSANAQMELHSILLGGVTRFEEVVWDKNTGVLLNGNPIDYRVPTRLDLAPLRLVNIESRGGYGAYGAMSNGHSHFTRAVVVSAVANAIGVWPDTVPLSSDKVLRALGKIK